MEITINEQEGIKIVEISGQLDGTTSPIAQNQIMPLIDENKYLIFNMKNCTYVSSSGLRVLMMAGKQLSRTGGSGALASLCDEVREVMEMTGFSHIFKNYPTIQDAVNALKSEMK